MKTLRLIILLIALIGIPAVTFTGCGTVSVQRKAVNTLYSIHKSVDAAYNTYLDLIVANAISSKSLRSVSDEYFNFQTVYNAAVAIVANDTNAPAPPSVLDAASKFGTVVESAKKGN